MGATIDYSTTAASNTTVGGVNIAEGMAPGSVNNAMRAMMADSRKWQLDWSGVTTAGTSNAYTLTCNQGIAAYADGQRFSFRADRNNTGAATLNIDARGAKALRKVSGGALAALDADDIVAKAIYDVVFNAADDVFVITGGVSLTSIQTQLNAKGALPQLASGAGQWTVLSVGASTDVTLPAGGTWAWFVLSFTTPGNLLDSASNAGVDAGGTTIRTGAAGRQFIGFAWRVA